MQMHLCVSFNEVYFPPFLPMTLTNGLLFVIYCEYQFIMTAWVFSSQLCAQCGTLIVECTVHSFVLQVFFLCAWFRFLYACLWMFVCVCLCVTTSVLTWSLSLCVICITLYNEVLGRGGRELCSLIP